MRADFVEPDAARADASPGEISDEGFPLTVDEDGADGTTEPLLELDAEGRFSQTDDLRPNVADPGAQSEERERCCHQESPAIHRILLRG